ncbi:transposase [Pseudomonas cichorii]|uniref:REP-associated tyrosine transposase n=1 Tax=Pseudomonas cichorii TaxID=36746 RepID=UPI0019103FA8|nr:transposase [Pseudomonas cichorii]GFM66721.1 transposase [Pseudomonas cichorii]
MAIVNHGADLRKGRYSEIGRVYLLTSVVHERRQIFDDWRAGRLLVDEFRKVQQEGGAHSLAWVVMPDHFHWLVELQSGSLGLLMRRVKSGSSRAIMATGCVQSRVWQKGYHDRAVRREEDLRSIARYIVANPLRAGLVSKIGDYPLWDAVWL